MASFCTPSRGNPPTLYCDPPSFPNKLALHDSIRRSRDILFPPSYDTPIMPTSVKQKQKQASTLHNKLPLRDRNRGAPPPPLCTSRSYFRIEVITARVTCYGRSPGDHTLCVVYLLALPNKTANANLRSLPSASTISTSHATLRLHCYQSSYTATVNYDRTCLQETNPATCHTL